MNQLNDTELSGPHKRFLSVLREVGVAVVSEYKITIHGHKYKLDCFLPDYLVAVEVDGPYHHKKHDKTRDDALYSIGVLTMRVPADTAEVLKVDAIAKILEGLEESIQERKQYWDKRKDFE